MLFILKYIRNGGLIMNVHAGIEVTSMACCGTGMFEMGYACDRNNPFTCTDADKYVFWDAFHPTQKINQIVANYVVKRALIKFD